METRRILLIGLGETALSALQSLCEGFRVLGVVRPASRVEAGPDPVEAEARALAIPLFREASPAGVAELVADLRPDAVVVSSYHRILDRDLLAKTRFVNVHYSRLPRYRGRANVNWALINGEDTTAITIHVMSPGLDAGNILFQQVVPIRPRDSVGALYRRLNDLQRVHLGPTVVRYLSGFEGVPQQEEEATYGCTRTPDDGLIDWTASSGAIDRLIRALGEPFPGAFGYLDGRRLTIWKAVLPQDPPRYAGRIPGRVVRVSRREGYCDVLTGDGVLRLLEVQLEGGPKTAAAEVVRSVKSSLGLSPVDLIAQIRDLEARLASLVSQQERQGGP